MKNETIKNAMLMVLMLLSLGVVGEMDYQDEVLTSNHGGR